ALPDERDHVHLGARVARDHAEERTLADARAGEDPEPLTSPAGEERVDRSDAEVERLADRRPVERVQPLAVEGILGLRLDPAPPVERAPEPVEDTAEHAVTHPHERPLAEQHD